MTNNNTNPSNPREDELKDTMNGIVAVADAEREKSDAYQDLFEGSADMESLLRRAELDMTDVVLNTTRVLKQKFGFEKIPDDVFWMLCALPFLEGKLTKHIQTTQGRACSVDKSFYHLARELEAKLAAQTNGEGNG